MPSPLLHVYQELITPVPRLGYIYVCIHVAVSNLHHIASELKKQTRNPWTGYIILVGGTN